MARGGRAGGYAVRQIQVWRMTVTSRLSVRPFAELTPEQQAQHERIARFRKAGPDGQIGGPYDPWIRSPELAQKAVSFGNFIWERTVLGRRIVELAIIVTARHWESNVEWSSHARMAKENGVSDAVIADVFALRRPAAAPADELVTIDVCRALHGTHQLPPNLYERAVETFGEQGLVELMATIGFYTFVSMTLNAFDIPVGAGLETPFPR